MRSQHSKEIKMTIMDIHPAPPANENIVIDTIQMTDVKAAFGALSMRPSREYYKCPIPPTGITGSFESHFKGVARFGGKLIFTHTDLDFLFPACNGKYLIGDAIVTGEMGTIEFIGDTLHPGWCHPCGSQVCGNFMAVGIQQSAQGPGALTSQIQICDVTNVLANLPMTLVACIERPTDGINGVGFTKEAGPNGQYIVAAVNGTKLDVYRSLSTSLGAETSSFAPVFDMDFPDSGAGLGLITQANGEIYLVSMNADDDGGDSHIALYQLDLEGKTCKFVTSKKAPIPDMSASITMMEQYLKTIDPPLGGLASWLLQLASSTVNTSFRWGRGLAVTSADNFELYATDRNVLVVSDAQQPNSNKNFSILVWGRPDSGSAG
jgi:hypothetical protein